MKNTEVAAFFLTVFIIIAGPQIVFSLGRIASALEVLARAAS